VAQVANCILAGPSSGGNAAPTCRALVAADLPSTAVTGSGTSGNLPKFTGASTVGNSLLTDSGATLTYTGANGIVSPALTAGAGGVTAPAGNALYVSGPTGQGMYLGGNNTAQWGINSGGTLFAVAGSKSFSTSGGSVTSGLYATATNCSSAASPAVCGSAAAGSVLIPTGTTSETLVVNTSAVTASSQIFFYPDDSLGTKLGVTCNSTLATLAGGSFISARSAGVSFTITFNGSILTNGVCGSYNIVN
jgi:hypothetical protein